VLRGLFGKKSDRPSPPKGQIEVICPACGAAQFESRLVVSTFCRKCGVHLSVNRGKVTASTSTRSGGLRDDSLWDHTPDSSAPKEEPTPTTAAVNRSAAKQASSASSLCPIQVPAPAGPVEEDITKPATAEEVEEGGFGVFLKQQVAPAAAPLEKTPDADAEEVVAAVAPPEKPEEAAPPEPEKEAPPQEPAIPPRRFQQAARRPQSNSPPPTPSPEPMSASTLQKMKEQGIYRNAYFKDADCFECRHKFKVSRSSRSANCPQCGTLISLEDVEINMNSTQPIKTRGDVLIRKRGHLSTDVVQCRDLRCQGLFEANVHASGDAIFRATGTIIGEIHCRRFIIEKGADVTFMNVVRAEEVEIQARVTGTIISSGPLLIGSGGSVNGDVTARSVSIEPGGELNGGMNIVRSAVAPSPAPPASAE
jgi:cytoskeletal protein CcmA (bactofilin family)